MQWISKLGCQLCCLDKILSQTMKPLASLGLRLYLVPIFWMAGMQKFNSFDDTVTWFGNPDGGLGLPFPWLMAFLATATELLGAVFLALGLLTRWISIPLIVTMLVAIFSVHIDNGWQAIADPHAAFANQQVMDSAEKLARARDILQEHGHYEWLTSSGSFVILNNGIEFAATYMLMLMALIALGSGKWISLDYWIIFIQRKLFNTSDKQTDYAIQRRCTLDRGINTGK